MDEQTDAGIGPNVDSYFEYLLKGSILFNDQEYEELFEKVL